MVDDFANLGRKVSEQVAKKARVMDEGGSERAWLKVYETLPPQLLNAYGEAKYTRMGDEKVWDSFSSPQKTGAKYMTELCSNERERRGVGINRFLHAMISYVEYQQDEKVRRQNQMVLQEVKCKELYEEIEMILPSLKYCLAPRKAAQKSGAASLRASAVAPEVLVSTKSAADLDKHAKCIFDWLSSGKPSRIRMLLHWQSAGGLSHVAAVYHRSAQCFVNCGNKLHSGMTGEEVSLSEFSEGIRCRHEMGDAGIDGEGAVAGEARDFA